MSKLILLLFAAYVAMNGWILWWFWNALRTCGGIRWAALFVLLALMAFFPTFYPHGNSSGSSAEKTALWLGSLWIGSFLYVFAMTVAARTATFLAARYGLVGLNEPKLALVIAGLTVSLGVAGWINAAFPVVRETVIRVEVNRNSSGELPSPVTIAALSDLHIGRINGVDRLSRAIDHIAPLNPDVVVFLGDVIDDHIAVDEAGMRKELQRLSPPLAIWGILGNHEYISGPIATSVAMLENAGIRVLRDEHVVLESRIALVGRDDLASSRFGDSRRKDLEDILADMDEEARRLPLVILDHQPRDPGDAEKAGAVLQLSGHTHNGQLWPYNLVAALVYENAHGLSLRGRTNYLVSAGTGTWGPPFRNNARPEVLWIRLEFVEGNEKEKK